ncbi:cohesin complex subunit [Glonium stellatum]|uniref:Structural maintenance of chromosomes protein n=1 Tax=Glonium stellatum TaxID=574774 RepID=A0A8E2JMR3_9PEZI|nr:cohesin complex subunit [Glonium stellatum]
MGKLVRLELKDFKSYRGHHVLLFGDSYFTSIIGPNGSGKSNSMDAISFVLGIKSSHLRSTHLRDLVYRGRVLRTSKINADGTATEQAANGDGESDDEGTQRSSQRNDPQSAWVMAVYEDDAGEEQKWKRTITSAGQSEYRINNRVVTAKQYNDALEAEAILIKARNFLVFQGDVEAVASQSPRDLTRLIEQISGSLEYKAEYDQLKIECEKAIDDQTFKLNQRRAINAEIKQYQEQKQEAEEYERKAEERDQAVVTHVLWKLFHFQRVMQESGEQIQVHQEELKEHRRGVEKYHQRLEDAKKDQAKVARDVSKIERNIRNKEKEIEEKENGLVPIDEKIRISNRDLQKYQTRIAEITKDRDNQARVVEQHQKNLSTVKKAQKKWEDEWKQVAQQEGRELSEADLQEYNRLRGDVTKRTSADQIQVNNLARQVKTDEETVGSLKSKVELSQAQVQKLEDEISELQDRRQNITGQIKQTEQEINIKKKEYNQLTSERLRSAQHQTELNERLQDVLTKLLEADNGRRQSEKDMRAREIVAAMKRVYSNAVRGRVHELCKPKQKKYEAAVSTVLGRHFDAIVVDTEKTAKDCIQFLREQRYGQATFIPLDTIQVQGINSNLKGMHRGMRLAIDTIDYDSSVERAMSYACGNAIVCDDLSVAKYLCYDKGVEAKAVTLDGTVIHKGGLMTGGRGPSDRNTKRWEDTEIENLRKVKDNLLERLAELPKGHRRGTEEETLQGELAGLEHRLNFAQDEVKALDRNIQSKIKEHAFVKNQFNETQPKYQDLSQRLEQLRSTLKTYEDAIGRVEDEVYAAFCQRLGYENIRDYEAQQGSLQQDAAEKRLEFTKQRSRLENQLSFETNRLQATNDRIKALEEQSKRDEDLIASLRAEKEDMQNSLDVLSAELETFKEALTTQQEKAAQKSDVVAEHRRELAKRNKSVEGVLRAVAALEAEIQRNAAGRYALLRKCKIDEIKIPLEQGSKPLSSLPLDNMLQEDQDAMDVDEDPDATLQVAEVQDYGIEVDFDELDEELKNDPTPQREATLLEIISNLNSALDKMSPNMRAIERLETVLTRLKSTEKEFDAARRAAKRAKDAFEDAKLQRLTLFQKAFSHIAEQIGTTYRELTRSSQFPMGGQAYLDTEDSAEPYLSGLKYHAMPPLKRFRDMEHLSGGEKTIAALALLFAIHSFQPSPFFVLDEVDAALDNVNVSRVAKYVKEHAGPGMQFIVISLKSGLFQESEGLVGVMRDQSRMSSRVVSLDLRKYQPS